MEMYDLKNIYYFIIKEKNYYTFTLNVIYLQLTILDKR